MSDVTRRQFIGSAATVAALMGMNSADASTDFAFKNNVPDPLLAGSELPTFKFELEKSEGKVIGGSSGKESTVEQLPIAKGIAGVSMRLEPGAMRELHWHEHDEWQYYISGRGRMTVFASGGKARTFNYQAGDVGTVPRGMAHYVQNLGDEPLRFLELFRSPRFMDVSLNQWMALTPPELVQAHLNLDRQTMAALRKDKPIIVK
jgi:oxalate decarboxylase